MSKDSVVEIYVNGDRQATGTVVGKDKVITCLHVIDSRFEFKNYSEFDKKENPENLKIEIAYNGKKHSAKITRGNQHHDLCLLDVKGLKAKAIPVVPKSYALNENDRVFSVGLPKGKMYGDEGKITRLDKIKSGEPSLVINDAPSKSGCSGGALLNENGELIGIQSLNGASIPHAWINELLSRSDNKIISRSQRPETEVDHYFGVISSAHAMKPSITPVINWVLQRPESQFATINFLRYSINTEFKPNMVESPDDYEKVLKTLEDNKPKSGSKCEWMQRLSDIVPHGTAYKERYLLKALENAKGKEKQAELYFALGEHNFYYAKNPKRAAEFFEKTISLKSGTDDCMAYEHLARIHLAAGDKTKAHQAFIGAFAAMCSKVSEAPEYFYEGIFERTIMAIEEKNHKSDRIPLFSGDFEKQEIFRKCMNHIKKISPSAPSV
ncbi:MAG: trypsin-like peptidase domain-containing protein [Pseudomonadota bacterium]